MFNLSDKEWVKEFEKEVSKYLDGNMLKEIVSEVENILILNTQLDKEYHDNMVITRTNIFTYRLFEKEYIVNSEWRGAWLKSTGSDVFNFRVWMFVALRDKLFGKNELIKSFKETCPNEKYIVNPIRQVQEVIDKISLLKEKNNE